MPTPLNKAAWAGVLMPSVDRVGRYYPLTLATPLAAVPDRPEAQAELWTWMQRLEDVAIDALEGDWSIDALDAGLAALGSPTSATACAQDWDRNLQAVEIIEPLTMKLFFAAASRESNFEARRGCCVWCCGSPVVDPRVFVSSSIEDSIARLWCGDLDNEAPGA